MFNLFSFRLKRQTAAGEKLPQEREQRAMEFSGCVCVCVTGDFDSGAEGDELL